MAPRRWKFFKRAPVHEATQRAWCRLLFVLGGALPVVVTFIACCAERLPAYQRARVDRYSQLLSQLTGLTVQVDRVELLTPTRRLLFGVQLLHPETAVPLGRIGGLWISETPTGCAIHVQQAELAGEHLADSYRLMHEQVLCRPSPQPHALVMFVNDLIVHSQDDQPITFSKLQLELKRLPAATTCGLRFRLAGVPDQEAVMTFDRHHDQAQPASHWTLNTGSHALPGRWIHYFAHDYSLPGNQSAFSGTFDLAYNQTFWNLQGTGRLHRIDTSAWFERPLLSGTAFVDVSRFSVNHQGLNDVAGSLLLQSGNIHTDLLRAAQDVDIHAVRSVNEVTQAARRQSVPYQTIAANFQLDSKGLQIIPRPATGDMVTAEDDQERRIIAWDSLNEPLAKLGQYSLVPMVNLAICLSKTTATETDRTTIASRLVQWLPKARPEVTPASYQISRQ